jgi:hypothetical protein
MRAPDLLLKTILLTIPLKAIALPMGVIAEREKTEASVFDDLESARKQKRGQDYIYEWDDSWRQIDLHSS